MTDLPKSPAAHYLNARLREIPSLFARLVFLAELGQPQSHTRSLLYPAADRVSVEAVDADVITRLSSQLFREWLALSTKNKTEDMKHYLTSLGRARMPDQEEFLKFAMQLVPNDASLPEKDLFLGTVKFITEMLGAQRSLS
jgi:hypothetical protein